MSKTAIFVLIRWLRHFVVSARIMCKNQVPSKASKPFKVQSLCRNCGHEHEDRLLCPFRALKFYLSRVKSIRGSHKRLFIPLKEGGDMSAATISRWVDSTLS
ncbi:hypothetical protein DPMN_034887 [Dreissena polymorpha]|uniref:Uncharacterized protein n=1 Tax=Dreissena polymorpha TaxID=45954 RepID=A0A9D4MAW9_DREPO|nr:hypothetical protein DPMN_034887 [Dreissena polymorpha]